MTCAMVMTSCRGPYLRAPYYAWIGRPWADARACIHHEQKVERPAMFPPTFLYTQSWEDPVPDMKVGKKTLQPQISTIIVEGKSRTSALASEPRLMGVPYSAFHLSFPGLSGPV